MIWVALFVCAELIDSLLGVDLTRIEDNAGEPGLIGTVGEVLGFKAETTATGEGGTELTLVAISPVVSVELHGGLGGVNLHGATALGLSDAGSKGEFTNFLLIDNEGVVVASTILNLLIIAVPIGAYGMRCAEVKRSAFHLEYFTSGDIGVISRHEEVGVNLYHLILNAGSGIGNTLEREETVVGHIDYGLLVGSALVVDHEFVVIGEGEHDGHLELAREAFFIISTGISHYDSMIVDLLSIPHTSVEACWATMEVVGAIIDGKAIFLAVELELATADAVAITSHEGGEERLWTAEAVVDVVVTLNDVGQMAITVGYHNGYDGTAIIGDGNLAAIRICQEEKFDLLAANFLLEVGLFEAADGGYVVFHSCVFNYIIMFG